MVTRPEIKAGIATIPDREILRECIVYENAHQNPRRMIPEPYLTTVLEEAEHKSSSSRDDVSQWYSKLRENPTDKLR